MNFSVQDHSGLSVLPLLDERGGSGSCALVAVYLVSLLDPVRIAEERMSEAISTDSAEIENAMNSFLDLGHSLFALAIIALGIETLVCGGTLTGNLIETNRFGAAIGPTLAACGVGSC